MAYTTDIDIYFQIFNVDGLSSSITQVNGIGRSVYPFLNRDMSRINRLVDGSYKYKYRTERKNDDPCNKNLTQDRRNSAGVSF